MEEYSTTVTKVLVRVYLYVRFTTPIRSRRLVLLVGTFSSGFLTIRVVCVRSNNFDLDIRKQMDPLSKVTNPSSGRSALEAYIEKRERQIEETKQELQSKETELKGENLPEWRRNLLVKQIEELLAQLTEDKRQLSEKERQLSEDKRQLSEIERQLAEKERQLSEKEHQRTLDKQLQLELVQQQGVKILRLINCLGFDTT
jgi:(p)ppGpp synthase/HD superfamily hydrolase